MIRVLILSIGFLGLSACAGIDAPAEEVLDVQCDTGGRHGPTGVMDWRCVDGDGVQRTRTESLHRIIEGAPIESGDAQDTPD